MKIYTKVGDDGTTGIIGNERVKKSDLRIRAIGAVDEANALIGWAKCGLGGDHSIYPFSPLIESVQSTLFDIGADLASQDDPRFRFTNSAAISDLELSIDRMEEQLPQLVNFILPGGSEAASRLHIARCGVRKAEREIIALDDVWSVNPLIEQYINRLSDWLFVAARIANSANLVSDVNWNSNRNSAPAVPSNISK